MEILSYGYYKWTTTRPMGIIGKQAERFIADYHKLVEKGYYANISYAGELNCTCGGTEQFGNHYGMIIVGNEEETKAIKDMIHFDVIESFNGLTMEKLNENLDGVEKDYWETYWEERLKKSGTTKFLNPKISKEINDRILENA